MNLKIRKFELTDLDAILKIEKICFKEDCFNEKIFLDFYKTEPYGFLVAERDKKIIGYVIASAKMNENIISIAVLPKYRKKGIGGSLLEKGLEILKSKELNRARLMVRKSNRVARNFYEKYGFKIVGILEKYYKNEDALIMDKII